MEQRSHCQFYVRNFRYIFHICDQVCKFSLAQSPSEALQVVRESHRHHLRARQADAIQRRLTVVSDLYRISSYRPISPTHNFSLVVDLEPPGGSRDCTSAHVVDVGHGGSIPGRAIGNAPAPAINVLGVVEIDEWVVLGSLGGIATDNSVLVDATINVIRIALSVGVDGAVDHSADVEDKDQTAEHISALPIGLIQWAVFDVLEIWVFFLSSFALFSHSKYYTNHPTFPGFNSTDAMGVLCCGFDLRASCGRLLFSRLSCTVFKITKGRCKNYVLTNFIA